MPSTKLRVVTWNINSVRLRLPLLERVTTLLQPHIFCLQETKVEDSLFPHQPITDLGFPYQCIRGEKSYNGVAILSQYPIASSTRIPFCNNNDARHLSAQITLPNSTLFLHNLYVPAGGYKPDTEKNSKFAHKLNFVEEMSRHFQNEEQQPAILLGDLNIAPLPDDVWSHETMQNVVSHTPQEIERLNNAQKAQAWHDVLRQQTPPPQKVYTWWSYRHPQWKEKNYGRRLDHIWASNALAKKLCSTTILQEARGWQSPSDHVPVMAEFLLP